MSEDLAVRVRRFLEEVSKDWGVKPPGVVVHPLPEFVMGVSAYYDDYNKVIHIDPRSVSLRTVLHEFAHHLQEEYGLTERIPLMRETVFKPHCMRLHEQWAKFFESAFRRFYERLWREVVGV